MRVAASSLLFEYIYTDVTYHKRMHSLWATAPGVRAGAHTAAGRAAICLSSRYLSRPPCSSRLPVPSLREVSPSDRLWCICLLDYGDENDGDDVDDDDDDDDDNYDDDDDSGDAY